MTQLTEGVLCVTMVFLACTLRSIDRHISEEAAAIQQIAQISKQVSKDNADRDVAREEQFDELLEHLAGVTKRGKKT